MSTIALTLVTGQSPVNRAKKIKLLLKPGGIIYRLLLALALAVIIYVTTADLSHTAAEEINDKLAHVLSFLALAMLADLSFPKKKFDWTLWIPLFFFGLAIEVIQYHLPYRTFSLLDLTANATGIFIYGLSFVFFARRRSL